MLPLTLQWLMLLAFTTGVNAIDGSKSDNKSDPATGSIVPTERTLIKDLFGFGYEKSVRPVHEESQAVNVTFDMLFLRLVSLDEKTRSLTFNCILQKKWRDIQLQWNPKNYKGVTKIHVPTDRIWVPDIALYTNAGDAYTYVMNSQAVITNDGTVTWMPSAKLKSYCYFFDLSRFPYDRQRCDMVFGSWSHNRREVDIHHQINVTHEYIYDGDEWEVEKYTVKPQILEYYMNYFPTIIYTVVMKRTGVYYVNMFVWPSVLLAFLTAFLFLIPHQSKEKIHVGIAVILSSLLIMILMNDHLPTDMGTFPVIGRFLQFNIVMASAAIVLCTVVQNMFYRGSKRGQVPVVIKRLLLGKVARLMCVSIEPYDIVSNTASMHDLASNRPFAHVEDELEVNTPLPRSPTLALEKVLDEIRLYLKICANKTPSEPLQTTKELIVNEWRRLVVVIERLLFSCYIVISVLVAAFMLH